MKTRRPIASPAIVALTLALALPAAPAIAIADGDGNGNGNGAPTLDPEAIEVIEAMVDGFANAERLEAAIEMAYVTRMPGMRQEMTTSFTFALDRPHRIAMRLTDGMMGTTLVSDGEHLYQHNPMFSRYTRDDAPADVEELLDWDGLNDPFGTSMAGGGSLALIAPLISRSAYDAFSDTIIEARHLGREQIAGQEHHHIRLLMGIGDMFDEDMGLEGADEEGDEFQALAEAFADMRIPVELWISVGDAPRLTRMRPDLMPMMRASFEQMGDEMGEQFAAQFRQMEIEFDIHFKDWRVDEPIDDDAFAFEPPEGAELSDSMFDFDDLQADLEATDVAGEAGNRRAGAKSLVGEPAPPFELELLGEDRKVALAEHQERGEIVILDFWATWCGPCIRAMPALMEVRDEYADRDVVLYAVNLRESPQRVEPFIQERGWELLVPMDRTGEVGEAYHARAIPQTVIVDTDGVVQAVHIGASPRLKETLRSELDTLLAGGSLIDAE